MRKKKAFDTAEENPTKNLLLTIHDSSFAISRKSDINFHINPERLQNRLQTVTTKND